MALTQAELFDQWTKAVDILDKHIAYADATATSAGEFDTLISVLEGEYTPGLVNSIAGFRAGLSALASPGTALSFLEPIVFEMGQLMAQDASAVGEGFGSGYTNTADIMKAMYDYFVANSLTVQTRTITFDTTAGLGASNVGNGGMTRLTVDENAFNLEACHVETKIFRCRSDQNTGTNEHAENFECLGEAPSQDDLLISEKGTGTGSRTFIRSLHAGSGAGGSLLRNSSFSTFDNTATPKFVGWDQTVAGTDAAVGDISQSTGVVATNFYRSHPGASTNGSLELTAAAASGADNVYTFTQTLANMRVSRLDPDTPYFLRCMYKSDGTAVGQLRLRLGGATAETVTVAGSAWNELYVSLSVAAASQQWPRQFNQQDFGIDIEWAATTAGGVLLIDDVIFAPYTLIDGTWWALRGNSGTHISWLVDDYLEFDDTGGAPTTSKIGYWLWRTGLGYLPSDGTPDVVEP